MERPSPYMSENPTIDVMSWVVYAGHIEAENAALRKRVEELEFDNEVLRGELKNPL